MHSLRTDSEIRLNMFFLLSSAKLSYRIILTAKQLDMLSFCCFFARFTDCLWRRFSWNRKGVVYIYARWGCILKRYAWNMPKSPCSLEKNPLLFFQTSLVIFRNFPCSFFQTSLFTFSTPQIMAFGATFYSGFLRFSNTIF